MPDTLGAEIAFSGLGELLALFERMGRPLQRLPAGAPRPIPGKSYSGDEWESLRHPISAWPEYEELGLGPLLGVECHVSVGGDRICIYLSGAKDRDFWSVTDGDYRNAKAMENTLLELGIVPVALAHSPGAATG